jgi:hypothetical protein
MDKSLLECSHIYYIIYCLRLIYFHVIMAEIAATETMWPMK